MSPTPTSAAPARAATDGAAPNIAYSTHTLEFTGYMRIVTRYLAHRNAEGLARGAGPLKVLDIPAGAGQVTQALRDRGCVVTPADINQLHPDYVFADMTARFPFEDGAFDAAICLEGIEHMIDPVHLLKELLRVVRPGGWVILSTPNVMNMYSRLQFLFTGTLHQFCPSTLRDIPPDVQADRFHIAPMDYHRVRYLAEYYGAGMEVVLGDKWKRAVLLPVYGLIWVLGYLWARRLFFNKRANPYRARNERIFRDINSAPALFSRSIIFVLRKNEA